MNNNPTPEPEYLQHARNLRFSHLTTRQVRTVRDAFYRLACKRTFKTIPDTDPWRKMVVDLWILSSKELEAREIKVAAQKDKGEILWSLCSLKDRLSHYYEYTRTPHRMITKSVWAGSYSPSESSSTQIRKGRDDQAATDWENTMNAVTHHAKSIRPPRTEGALAAC